MAALNTTLILSLSRDINAPPCRIGGEALRWLRLREREDGRTPTLRAVSRVLAPAAPEPEVHRAVIDLLRTGFVRFTHMHTGRVIYVHLNDPGRVLGDRLIAKAGMSLDDGPATVRNPDRAPLHV